MNSGTSALWVALAALGIGPGDEVIVPPMTFAATANTVVLQGGTPVFVDVDPDTLLIDAQLVKAAITPKTKAIAAVDYAGQMCDYEELGTVAKDAGVFLLYDACHALGGSLKGKPCGSWADLTVFSFHPVKPITTGEGGMIVTDRSDLSEKMMQFRNHGIDRDLHHRREKISWEYRITELGVNYRLTDIQCALGISQLEKLDAWIERRNEIALEYDRFFSTMPLAAPLKKKPDLVHAYHLYVVRIDFNRLGMSRRDAFTFLHENGVGVNVHYIPVHLHPYYKNHFNTAKGMCPVAEDAYEQILTVPVFPGMDQDDVRQVCLGFEKLLNQK